MEFTADITDWLDDETGDPVGDIKRLCAERGCDTIYCDITMLQRVILQSLDIHKRAKDAGYNLAEKTDLDDICDILEEILGVNVWVMVSSERAPMAMLLNSKGAIMLSRHNYDKPKEPEK